MEKEIVVLSTSNVELDSIGNGENEMTNAKLQKIGNSIESPVNGVIENSNHDSINNSNNSTTNGKSTSRHGSNGFNACKTEWVRLNIGKNFN